MRPGNEEFAPILSLRCADFLSERARLRNIVDCFGSPVHVLFPSQAAENARLWSDRTREVYAQTKTLFAYKACKSDSLAKAFSGAQLGADVSSVQEFVAAMSCGVRGGDISVTGPDKTCELLDLANAHGAAVHIDSEEEMTRLLRIGNHATDNRLVFLRIKPPSQIKSRFGLDQEKLFRCIHSIKPRHAISIGLSFHLNEYALEERVAALRWAIRIAEEAATEGVLIRHFDIGGGYPLRYTATHSIECYRNGSHLSGNPEINAYPYAAPIATFEHAAAIIGRTLKSPDCSDFLTNNDATLYLEPGRALLDQCGVTLMRVIATKSKSDNEFFVILEGMSFSVSERWFSSDFAPTPILIGSQRGRTDRHQNYYLVGQSCLESDILRNRAVRWRQHPEPGDIVCFVNTAGYQMDSNESTFHQIPLPEKVAALQDDEDWKIHRDARCNIRILRNDHQISD